jgi:hypothetical protein
MELGRFFVLKYYNFYEVKEYFGWYSRAWSLWATFIMNPRYVFYERIFKLFHILEYSREVENNHGR